MKLADLPTPCLVLDRTILDRNIRSMAAALARLRVPLRPHMKTAKSIDVARLAIAGQPGGITVSTLAARRYVRLAFPTTRRPRWMSPPAKGALLAGWRVPRRRAGAERLRLT